MPLTMMLPCTLTDADRLRIEGEKTGKLKEQEDVEAQKKEAVRGYNVTLKALKAEIHDLNESHRTGTELRDVEIEERPDYKAGIIFIHRLDTGDCVKERAIDPDERQVKLGIDGPKLGSVDGEKADEQREASTPEEAEALRAERLASERAERISAAVQEARERIAITSDGGEEEGDWKATLQFGNRVLEAEAATAAAAADGVAQQVTEHLEGMEDAITASAAEQKRQEIERLAAEQAADDANTKKSALGGLKNGGLKVPRGHKRKTKHETTLPDGRVVDPEEEAAKIDATNPETDIDPLLRCTPDCDAQHEHTAERTAF